MVEEEGVQKFFPAFQFSYQIKSCSECQQDDRTTCRHANMPTDSQTVRQTDRQTEKQI